MASPASQTRAPAPAPSPAARTAAGRSPGAAGSKRKGAGKPAVRLTDKAPRPRGGAGAAAEAAPAAEPKQAVDPRLKKALDKNRRNAKALQKHDPAAAKAAEAQDAAEPPSNAKLEIGSASCRAG